MARKKSPWTPWKTFAKKIGNRLELFQTLEVYPKSVQATIVAAVTVAQVMLQKQDGDAGSSVVFCALYRHDCYDCLGGNKDGDCKFPESNQAGIYNAIQVYNGLYRKMPKRWQKELSHGCTD